MYSNKLVCDILDYIDLNLNSKITIDDLSKKFYYNRYYLMKLFKKEIGITIFEYINTLRINNALKEIRMTNHTYTNVSINNGFYSLEYFSETFKAIIGVSPSLFKKFCHNDESVNDDLRLTIITNMTSIEILLEKVQKYRNHLKPTTNPIRKLSIFH